MGSYWLVSCHCALISVHEPLLYYYLLLLLYYFSMLIIYILDFFDLFIKQKIIVHAN